MEACRVSDSPVRNIDQLSRHASDSPVRNLDLSRHVYSYLDEKQKQEAASYSQYNNMYSSWSSQMKWQGGKKNIKTQSTFNVCQSCQKNKMQFND